MRKKCIEQHVHVWGCQVWVHSADGSKLDVRAREARWLGFDLDMHAHCIYRLSSGRVAVK